MRPTEGSAGRPLGGDRGTAGEGQRAPMIADRGDAGKQAVTPFLRLGNCANCGQRIRLVGGVTTCPTCAAWRRWYIAHRIASRYLREATR